MRADVVAYENARESQVDDPDRPEALVFNFETQLSPATLESRRRFLDK